MKYVSTRNKNVFLSASETIAQGLADDGGLLTPEVFPKLTPEMLEDLTRQDLRPAGRGRDEAVPGQLLRGRADFLHRGRVCQHQV